MERFSDEKLMQAVFFEQSGTLYIYGHGAVVDTDQWLFSQSCGDKKLVRKIVFGRGVTSIGDKEFYCPEKGYYNLETVVFLDDINRIGKSAFYGNMNLHTIVFSGKCRSIGELAFQQCAALQRANVPKGCRLDTWLTYTDHNPFYESPLEEEFERRILKGRKKH